MALVYSELAQPLGMEILFVRHGESEGNAEGRMQGHSDYPLSPRGTEQARVLGNWLARRRIEWHAAYASPLARARQTADLITGITGQPPAASEPDLAELRAGQLEGLTRAEMLERHPTFLERTVGQLGDFSEFGGEGYDDVQARARRLLAKIERAHREREERVLLVAHGGINFQLLKLLICEPVPRVCILRMENCTCTLVRMRDRRGSWLGEVVWHVPIELMGGESQEGSNAVFR
jgi:broad specificity phosphatase PhoE